MNKAQRIILVAGAVGIMAMGAFPPWEKVRGAVEFPQGATIPGRSEFIGFYPILSPPKAVQPKPVDASADPAIKYFSSVAPEMIPDPYSSVSISWILLVEMTSLGAAVGLLFVAVKSKAPAERQAVAV